MHSPPEVALVLEVVGVLPHEGHPDVGERDPGTGALGGAFAPASAIQNNYNQ